jgi:hypothetical protein
MWRMYAALTLLSLCSRKTLVTCRRIAAWRRSSHVDEEVLEGACRMPLKAESFKAARLAQVA